MTAVLDHDNRSEACYPCGRQPFSYIRIIQWAKANGRAYKFFRDAPTRYHGGVKLGLAVREGGQWTYYRGVNTPPLLQC